MELDSFTIKIAATILSAIMAVTMFAMYKANKEELCFFDWAGAGFFNTLGYISTGLLHSNFVEHGENLNSFFLGLSNTCYFLAHCAILRGLLRHLNLRLFTTEMALAAIIVSLAHQFPVFSGSFENRIILFFTLILIIKMYALYVLGRVMSSTKQWSYAPLFMIEVFFVTQMAVRALMAVSVSSSEVLQDFNHPIQAIGWLADLLYISVATLACVLVVVREQVLEIRRLSLTDQLTGCLNRRAMQTSSEQSFEESKRINSVFGVIAIDIDFFKKINDTFGHDAGDSVIKSTTQAINRRLRKVDKLFRMGGEEFIVTTVGTPLEGISVLAEKIREEVESIKYAFNGTDLNVTISLGISISGECDCHWEEVLKRADDALYEAKRAGRNRVVQSQSTAASTLSPSLA
ncbi:GGDEF domain-containing protein [Pseudoalteromonas sp. GB56]